jgi:hypothetical protein
MYLAVVVLLMCVLPVGSIVVEALIQNRLDNWILLIGRWFAFWTVGIRLLVVGARQATHPEFTAIRIFGIKSKEPLPIIQELGFANIAMGVLGTFSILNIHWIVPSALVGTIFYGFTGINRLKRKGMSTNENIAKISDMFAFVVLLAYIVLSQI